MEDRQARHRIKARRRHVKIIANANHIRIGVVGMNDRIFVRAVAIIGNPYLGNEGGRNLLAETSHSRRQ